MVITLDSELETALSSLAKRKGIAPETLALKALRDRFVTPSIQPRDDWERLVLDTASDCGVSLSNEAVSSEGLYD
jgi:hypothetical protein